VVNLLAPVQGWSERRALRGERRRADDELVQTRLPSPRLAWRTQELVADANRVDLGRSLTELVHAADERLLPSARPLDRNAVRENRAELLDLASRLFAVREPVQPRGILLAERLLLDGSGPLYGRNDPIRLRLAVRKARAALEGDDGAGV
jgi:hypothetical protein